MMTFAKTAAMGAAMMIAAVVAVPAMAKPAAVSHDGKYVSNEAKSYWSNGEFPKGFRLSIDLKWTANKLEYHAVNTTNPAKPYLNNFEATLDDVPSPCMRMPASTRFASSNWMPTPIRCWSRRMAM